MRFRKLRIAWSVVWGLVAVLLIVLWVRSYWWADFLFYRATGSHGVASASSRGKVNFGIVEFADSDEAGEWIGSSRLYIYSVSTPPQLSKSSWGIGTDNGPPREWALLMPHWFPVLILGIVATAPWVRQLRWQFSLRTLLIATTLVAVVLGLIVLLR